VAEENGPVPVLGPLEPPLPAVMAVNVDDAFLDMDIVFGDDDDEAKDEDRKDLVKGKWSELRGVGLFWEAVDEGE
jgi:hypothetical protein